MKKKMKSMQEQQTSLVNQLFEYEYEEIMKQSQQGELERKEQHQPSQQT